MKFLCLPVALNFIITFIHIYFLSLNFLERTL